MNCGGGSQADYRFWLRCVDNANREKRLKKRLKGMQGHHVGLIARGLLGMQLICRIEQVFGFLLRYRGQGVYRRPINDELKLNRPYG